ncbi:MAG: AAA-associated domain-containing protein [Caldisericum sp.]|nr:AAA-associated domain-containing protein [Caldisericum sp.]
MDDISPLPYVEVGKLIGLLVYLDDSDGKVDIYMIPEDIEIEADELISLLKLAQMMNFVEVKEGDVFLTDLGRDLVEGDENKRKIIFKDSLKKLPIFKKVINILIKSKDNSIDKEDLLEILQEEMSESDAEETLKSIIELGRYAELIGYNPEDKEVYLDKLEEI